MDKQRLKRLEEFIAPLRVKPGKRVKLARDFDPAYKAEINVVLSRRLWPRSLFSPAIKADEEALTALAKVQERTEQEKIDVRFEH